MNTEIIRQAWDVFRQVADVATPFVLVLVLRTVRKGADSLESLRGSVDSAHRAAHAAENTGARVEAAAKQAEDAAKTASSHAQLMTRTLQGARDEYEREKRGSKPGREVSKPPADELVPSVR